MQINPTFQKILTSLMILEENNELPEYANISQPLRNAIQEAQTAIRNQNYKLATRILGVKDFIYKEERPDEPFWQEDSTMCYNVLGQLYYEANLALNAVPADRATFGPLQLQQHDIEKHFIKQSSTLKFMAERQAYNAKMATETSQQL